VKDVAVVAIGRNEGERLRICLESVLGEASAVVYVDSGSRDGSVALARCLGAEVVTLDSSVPFTAARARNAGAARVLEISPTVRSIQFVDGDCEVAPGWLETACDVLSANPDLAVVCGRRRERFPEKSPYNRLADLEWDTPIGEAKSCGGDALIRVTAFELVGGYDPSLIAGEEPDICVRLRARGWKIARLDAEMTMHDIAMTHLSQWWRRSMRAGHAFAEGASRHGAGPDKHWVRETKGALAWGLVLPLFGLALAWATRGASLALLLAYPLQYFRLSRRLYRAGFGSGSARDARLYALACVVGKFPQAIGLIRYWSGRLLGRRARLIEYKSHSEERASHGATESGLVLPSAQTV
jgi:GT2 family glycosyltransferase